MSKRPFCQQCNKALSACICGFILPINNQYFLHVLQDPSEQNKAIGTARILDLSLSQVKVTVGEHFNPLDFDLDNTFLVFPEEQADSIQSLRKQQRINNDSHFIILDGSWKKAYKLLMSNPFLQALPKVILTLRIKANTAFASLQGKMVYQRLKQAIIYYLNLKIITPNLFRY